MNASKLQESEVRIAHSLNLKEENFAIKRRSDIWSSLKTLGIKCSQDKVPNIALLGSGGGQRAMVALLGSLDQLDKAGLLNCLLYLSGVSGSTWCMASLYQEPEWSTKLQNVKDNIVSRISGPPVSWSDAYAKMKKYYSEKEYFTLTDVWAVMVVTTYVKEIDEQTLIDQLTQHMQDPFPIYTLIDKECKQSGDVRDSWFEISPCEAGYSLTGAFVKTPSFGSQFENGEKRTSQPEVDMLLLQALCGSALADGEEIIKFLWEKIKGFFKCAKAEMTEQVEKDPTLQDIDTYTEVLEELVDINICLLDGQDPTTLDHSIRKNLKDIIGHDPQLIDPDKSSEAEYTLEVCGFLEEMQVSTPQMVWPVGLKMWIRIFVCMAKWTWGRNFDFLYNMRDPTVPAALLTSETRDYMDAGLLLNSPYFSVLRTERNIDLIISLDFSEGDPFLTVKGAAEMCNKLNISFPPVHVPDEEIEKPKDFYVFTSKDKKAPTVIHIPLFNVINCGDKLEEYKEKYRTFQGPYSHEMINELMEIAGKNISNNKQKLIDVIREVIG